MGLDQIETFSLAISILILSCGTLLSNDNTSNTWKILATILIFLSMSLFIVYVIYKSYRIGLIAEVTEQVHSKVSNVKSKVIEIMNLKTKKKIKKVLNTL